MADPKTKKVDIENLDKKPTSVPFTSLYKSTKDGVKIFEQKNSIELTDEYLFKLNLGDTSYLTGKKELGKDGNAAKFVYLDASVLDDKTVAIFEKTHATEKVQLDGKTCYKLKADNITMMDVGQKERGFQISIFEGAEKITINAGARGFMLSQDGARLISKAPDAEECFSFALSDKFIENLFDEKDLDSSIQTTTGNGFKNYSPEFMLAIARIPELRKSGLSQPYSTHTFGNFEFFSAEGVKGKGLNGNETVNNLVFVRDTQTSDLFVLNNNKFAPVQGVNYTYANTINGEKNVALSLKVGTGSKTSAVRVPITLATKIADGNTSYTEGQNFQVLSGVAKFISGQETEINHDFKIETDGAMRKINLNGIVLNPHEYAAHSDIQTNAIRENIVNLDEPNIIEPQQPPVETPPAEVPPVQETPVEAPPIVETPPAEVPPIETPSVEETPPIVETPPSNGSAPKDNTSSNNNASNDAGVITRKLNFGPFSDFCKAAGPLLVIVGVALAFASIFMPALAVLLNVGAGLCVAGLATYCAGKSTEKFEKLIEYPIKAQQKAKKERKKATEKYRERTNEIQKLKEEAREATGKTKTKLEKKISNLEKTNFELLAKGDIRQVRAIMKDIQENASNYPQNVRENFFKDNIGAISLTVMDNTNKKVTRDFLGSLSKEQREQINIAANEIGNLKPEQFAEAQTKELIGQSGANYLENKHKRDIETQIKQKQDRLTEVETKNLQVLDKNSYLYQTFAAEAESLAKEITALKRTESDLNLHATTLEKAITLRNREKNAEETAKLIENINAAPVAQAPGAEPIQEEATQETVAQNTQEARSESGYTVEDYTPISVPEAVFDDKDLQSEAEEDASLDQENNQTHGGVEPTSNSSNSEDEEEDENERSR